jgi:hypothetical protein
MKSIPASSAIRASRRQSAQLANQCSGTLVADRPEEQLAPNRPIFSTLALYMAERSDIDAARANTTLLRGFKQAILVSVWDEDLSRATDRRAVRRRDVALAADPVESARHLATNTSQPARTYP